jgi:hypothetical protein
MNGGTSPAPVRAVADGIDPSLCHFSEVEWLIFSSFVYVILTIKKMFIQKV